MLAKDLITEDVPPLKNTDTIDKASSWMDDFKVVHLPVLSGRKFVGIVEEQDLLDKPDPDKIIGESNMNFINVFVYEGQHVFEVIKTVADHNLSLIPVLNADDQYIGNITLSYLMKVIAEMSVVSDAGGTIELELNANDYTLSEIARIVEMNGAKILGSFITSHPDSTKIQFTFKVNRSDLRPILQTFQRYNYTVTASFDSGGEEDDLKERFDSFMNYLNM
jgi:acetoin utilization protein AcuB